MAGAVEQGAPPLPVLLCRKRFVRRAGQSRVANSGLGLPGIHPNTHTGLTCHTTWSGEHRGVPSTPLGQESIVVSPQLTPAAAHWGLHQVCPHYRWGPWGGLTILGSTNQPGASAGSKDLTQTPPQSPFQSLGRKGSDGLKLASSSKTPCL